MKIDKWGYTICSYCHGSVHKDNLIAGKYCKWCVDAARRRKKVRERAYVARTD